MSPMYMCVTVGEEDEVSIKDAADMVIEAMDFKGEVVVSFTNKAVRMVHFPAAAAAPLVRMIQFRISMA